MKHPLKVATLAVALAIAGPAFGQGSAGSGSSTQSGQSASSGGQSGAGGQSASSGGQTSSLEQRGGDNRSNWGWLGLLGLIGLAGLRGRRDDYGTTRRSTP